MPLEIESSFESFIIPDGMIVISAECEIVSTNEAGERITGYSETELIGEKCSKIFVNPNTKQFILDSLNIGHTYSNLSIDILCKNNTIKNVLASITPVQKGNLNIIGVVFVFRDTKEMVALAKQLQDKTTELINERNKLEAIFNSNIEGTFTIDNDWRITSFNKSAEKITGYKKDEALGRHCWSIFKSNLCQKNCHMIETMEKGTATIGNELAIYTKRNTIKQIRVNSGILLDNKNTKIGAVETFVDISEIINLSDHITEKYKLSNIIGKNKVMERIFSLCLSVAQTQSSVLITGESGTGKELVARAIHLNSSNKNSPFIAINCSAFAETLIESELFGHEVGAFTGAVKPKIGRFELANGGTLFLDEIADISPTVQVKLLRVLETRQFERVGGNKTINLNARIIAATNKNLQAEIEKGNFREDLYFRINVMNIHLPPLRDRIEDLPLLIEHFLKAFNKKFNKSIDGISSLAYKYFTKYYWPGNIRELENVLEHCFILCPGKMIMPEHLPERIAFFESDVKQSPQLLQLKSETDLIIETLKKNNFNKLRTAEELGIHPTTLWRKIKKLKINY
ncbi:MAG TPA: sigma 54-interacting transcriptional regulator [Melioribacteraceae bacterium]|nr:sigma 54-interacting transcriptional regulator [Melioribacteraceae bacterium]